MKKKLLNKGYHKNVFIFVNYKQYIHNLQWLIVMFFKTIGSLNIEEIYKKKRNLMLY